MTNPTPTVLMRSLSLQSGLIIELAVVVFVESSSLLRVESRWCPCVAAACVGSLIAPPGDEEWEFQRAVLVVVLPVVVLVVIGSVQAAAVASAAGPKNKDEAALECR